MKVGDLVRLYGSDWLGIGVITALYTEATAYVYFPLAPHPNYGAELWRERLEVI